MAVYGGSWASATKSDLEDSPNGSKEKGKEGRKEKEVAFLEASSREPSIERSSQVGGLFLFLRTSRSARPPSTKAPIDAAQRSP
jgi:hypothetical protein